MENVFCYLFSFIAEAIILWLYSTSLFISRKKPINKFLILMAFYTGLFIVSLLEITWLNTFLYFFVNFIFILTQFDTKWSSALFHSAVLTAFMGICEMLGLGIIKSFIPHFLEYGREPHLFFLFAIINKLLFFTFTYTLTLFMKNHEKIIQQNDITSILLIFIPFSSIFALIIFVYMNEIYSLPSSLESMMMFSSFFLMATNLLVFVINQYNQKKNLEYTEMQLLLQKESDTTEYYQMLRSQNENQRILIHDIKKHLQSINLLNDQRDHEKITNYIKQLTLSSNLQGYTKFCNHDLLNSILCRYMQKCSTNQISFQADIRYNTPELITDADLTSIFCNLLDNAVEATDSLRNAFIEVTMYLRENSSMIVISVINSCEKNPFLRKNEPLITKKSDKIKHGFGLKSIQKTIKKYNGELQLDYDKESKTFHSIIVFKN